jgi:hypothetical protein
LTTAHRVRAFLGTDIEFGGGDGTQNNVAGCLGGKPMSDKCVLATQVYDARVGIEKIFLSIVSTGRTGPRGGATNVSSVIEP